MNIVYKMGLIVITEVEYQILHIRFFILSLYFFSVFGVNDEIEMNWIHFDQANILRFTVPQFLLILTVLFFLNLKAGRIEKLGQEEKNS